MDLPRQATTGAAENCARHDDAYPPARPGRTRAGASYASEGELKKLGIPVSATGICSVLRRHGFQPAPATRRAFLDRSSWPNKPPVSWLVKTGHYQRRRRVEFHFTPTHASWMNQVEVWFSILTRGALQGASFTSPLQVRTAIEAFVAAYNPTAEPFQWRKRAVRNTLLRKSYAELCK